MFVKKVTQSGIIFIEKWTESAEDLLIGSFASGRIRRKHDQWNEGGGRCVTEKQVVDLEK